MQFTINDREYTIEEFDDIRMDGRNRGKGYFWADGDYEGAVFETALEAQQDAIRHAESLVVDEQSEDDKQAEYHATHATSERSL